MKKPNEGLQLARELALPPDVVTQKINVLGQSGGGKTYLAMKIAELMLELPALIVAIDLVGVWPGLLSSADGLHPGFPVLVIGGEKGHLPLNPDAGRLTADVVYDRDVSVVLDASDLLAEDEEQLVVFLADFLEQLFLRHKRGKKRRHLFYEEAQEIFPETMSLKGHVRLRRIGTRLCKIGRNYGLGYTTITQEPQSTSKRILNQAGTLIAVRTIGELERKAIAGTARSAATQGLDLMNVLPELQTGEAMVWSPAWLKFAGKVHVLPKVTFDSSKTPDSDDDAVEPKVLAPVEVEQLRQAMAAAIAKVEAEDPTALKRRIAELERQLATRPAAEPKVVEVPVFDEKQRAALIEVEHQALCCTRALRDLQAAIEERARVPARATFAPAPAARGDPLNVTLKSEVPRVRAQVNGHAPAEPEDVDEAEAGGGELVGVLRSFPMGLPVATLAMYAGLAATGGGFRRALKELRAAGTVVDDGPGVRLAEPVTDAGPFQRAGAIALWQAKMGAAWPLIEVLSGAGAMPTAKLAAAVGQSAGGGGFRRSLKKMRQRGLAVANGDVTELAPAARELFAGLGAKAKTHEQIVEAWFAKLGDGPRGLLDGLLKRPGAPQSAAQLADLVGMSATGGGFRRNLKKLRTLRLIVENDAGIAPSPALFP